LMDDCSFHPPQNYINCESVAFTRSLMIIYTLIHRLIQTITSKENLQRSYYSLRHYRNASSQRFTFDQSIHAVKHRLNEHLLKIQDAKEKENTSASCTPKPPRRQRQQPSRIRITNNRQTCTTIPEKVDNTMIQVLGKTPLKTKKAIEKGKKIATPVQQRWDNCLGKPFLLEAYSISKDGKQGRRERHKCCQCGSKTSWYCVECKEWYCMEAPSKTSNNKREYSLIQSVVPSRGASNFQNACFHIRHSEAWYNQQKKHKK
jgi:hypothetical protein